MTHVTIQGADAEAILRFVFDGVPLMQPRFAPVISGELHSFPFDRYDSSMSLALDGSVRLDCRGHAGADPFRDLPKADQDKLNAPSRFRLSDGSSLTADTTNYSRVGGLRDASGVVYPGAIFDINHWSWTSSTKPDIWVGRVAGARIHRGNLSLLRRKGRSRTSLGNNLRLEGQCVWNLVDVPEENELVAVVSARDKTALTKEMVREDFIALGFALGMPIELPMLTGVDASLAPVAAFGLHLGSHPRHGSRSPTPHRIEERATWSAKLFSRVAEKLAAEHSDALILALGAYLDGISSHIDLGYLASQIALEAFSKFIVGSGQRHTLVKDSSEWIRWVKSKRAEIVAHAIDEASQARLMGKVESAQQAPSTDRVEAALAKFELEVPRQVLKEIGRRNTVAHEYWMSKPTARDVEADVDRRDLVLTLLTALIAKHTGYDGLIAGPDRDVEGYQVPPSWWPHTSSDDPDEVFVMERATAAPPNAEEIPHEQIAEAAYFRWRERGGGHGRAAEDWLAAEEVLRIKRVSNSGTADGG